MDHLFYRLPERPTVPCGLCGRPTAMTGTKRCDECWEIERRVQSNPELALRILESMGLVEPQEEEDELLLREHPELPLDIPLFSFGKYRNLTHDEVLDRDPGYIKWAFETVAEHAGIARSSYTAACEAVAQQRGRRDPGDDDGDRWEGIEDFDPPRSWGDLDD